MAPADPELRELIKEMNRSALAEQFRNRKTNQTNQANKNAPEPLTAEGEIFPSAILPVLAANKNSEPRVFPMKWGFTQNKKLIINARVETAKDKPTFREAWQAHRCIIPASCYFEWEHDENKKATQKYALRPRNATLIRLAGLYRIEDGLPVFVILTRPAHESLLWMHDRMPVMLPEEEATLWINPKEDPEPLVKKCLTDVAWQQAG